MNRMSFISPRKRISKPKAEIEVAKSKPLYGSLYVAMGFVPGNHRFVEYRAATVGTLTGAQRKSRRLSIAPIQYRDKEGVIKALNDLIRHIENVGLA